MLSVDAVMGEVVVQQQRAAQLGIDVLRVQFFQCGQFFNPFGILLMSSNFIKDLHLIDGRLGMGLLTSLNLECGILLVQFILN